MSENTHTTDPCDPETTPDCVDTSTLPNSTSSSIPSSSEEIHHVLVSEGIKVLIEMSRKLKIKERESDSLREENENLLEKLNNSENQNSAEFQKILIKKLEEAENRLKTRNEYFDKERSIYVKNMEEMRRRMEDSESFKRFNEKEIEELQKVIGKIPIEMRLDATDSSGEKETMEDLKRVNKELNDDLKSAEFQLTLLKSQQKMISDVMETEQQKWETVENQARDFKMLLEQKETQLLQEQDQIRILEEESLEIDYLRSQNQILSVENSELKILAENQKNELETRQKALVKSENPEHSEKSTSSEYSGKSKISEISKKSTSSGNPSENLIKNLRKLTNQIEELHEGRRLEEIPESFRSEAPAKFQSSEIFYRFSNFLNIILSGQSVPPKLISDFWDFLVKRAELTEKLIEEKVREVTKLNGEEIQRIEVEYQKEKKTMRLELEEMTKLAIDRLNLIKKMEKKDEVQQEDAKKTVPEPPKSTPNTDISSLAFRFNSKPPAKLRESESEAAAILKLKTAEKLTSFSRNSSVLKSKNDGKERLRQKLVDLESEHKKSEKDFKRKLKKIESELILDKKENRLNKKETLKPLSEMVYEGVVYKAHPEDPEEDKSWVLDRFLKSIMQQS